jgi:hypothetical protein
MRTATITSACECQAKLGADLDEELHVRRGWAADAARQVTQSAPAHRIEKGETFAIGWSCPYCSRNTLRRFSASMLVWSVADAVPTFNEATATQPAS